MTVHLRKLAVGVNDLSELAARQAERSRELRMGGEPALLRHLTRHTPRRAEELLNGGSLYWVIKGFIRVRQRIVGIEAVIAGEKPRCALLLDPELIATEPRPSRPFQGWRYLAAGEAPADAPPGAPGEAAMPAPMVTELRELGLL